MDYIRILNTRKKSGYSPPPNLNNMQNSADSKKL